MAGRKKAPPKRQRAEHTEPTNRASIWHGTSHPVLGEWIDPNDKSLGQVTEKNLASLVEAMAEGERPGKAARKTASVQSPPKTEKNKMEQPKEKEAEQLNKKKKTQHGACARGCVRVSVRARVRACACACLRACMRAGTGGIEPVITMTAACRGLLRA
jgi:hypothetical protein